MTVPGREDIELIVRLLSSTGVVAVHGLLMPVERELVSRIFTSWNQMSSWLSQLQELQRAA
jgi:hypothetical protein